MEPVIYNTPCDQWTELGGGTRRRIRSYDGQIMMVEVNFDAGAVGADHAHPHTQATYCLSGAFRVHIEGEEHILRAGDTLLFESGKVHGCTALCAGTLLDVFAPVREDFLR